MNRKRGGLDIPTMLHAAEAVRDELENPLTHEADVADDGSPVLGPNDGARK